MAPPKPNGFTSITVTSFGEIKGLSYESGVKQFCGIPYARLAKRWTDSSLNTTLDKGYHDGTQYGPIAPQPPEYNVGFDYMVPVPPLSHFQKPVEHEFDCLNLNIAIPPADRAGPHPVMVWIHGGSLLFGRSSHPSYDFVNLSSYAASRGTPIVCVSINYRAGLFGFLASSPIARDSVMSNGQFSGIGNFGLKDQQTALAWVQQFIGAFGGDPGNVTIFGESAGGMSVAHQVFAAQPAVFHRAISMSGTLNTIPVWSPEQHQRRWKALLAHFGIDKDDQSALAKLRAVSQADMARATCLIEGVMVATGNACNDGWFHAFPPSLANIQSPPAFLKSYMLGDVRNEAMIFRSNIAGENYASFRNKFERFLTSAEVDFVFEMYGMHAGLNDSDCRLKFEDMATDGIFKFENWLQARASRVPQTYTYHFDQISTLDNPLKGLAYHAIDILYVFMNLTEEMTPGQQELARKVSGDFIDFAYGKDPWERFGSAGHSMTYGPDDKWAVKTEEELHAQQPRFRIKVLLDRGILERFNLALDYIGCQRHRMGATNGLHPSSA